MNTSQEQLLHLLALTIHSETLTHESFLSINGNELFDLASIHNVCSFLYPTLKKYSEQIKLDELIMSRWKTKSLFLAVRQLSMMKEIKVIFDLFKSNNIPAISVKGLVLKQLYPQPELRNMCDLDLLIYEKDMEKSIELMSTLGYHPNPVNLNDPNHIHIEMLKPGSFSVDLHRTLWPSRNMKRRDNHIWFNHIWENKRLLEMEDIQFTALSPEDELIHLVIHLAKDIMYSGANLRQLFDIMLFLKTYWNTMDIEYVDRTLKSMELFTFYQYLLTACHLFLGLTIPDDKIISDNNKSELLINDFCNIEMNNQTTEDIESWKKLSYLYAFTRNNQFLIPLAFVIEVGRQFIKKKKGFFYSISFSKKSISALITRTHFLRSIGLLARL